MNRREFLMSAAAGASAGLTVAACGGGADGAPVPVPAPAVGGVPPAPAPAPTSALPAWVANLPLWQWHQIPGTALSSVPPSVFTIGNPAAKITAWCGAALRRSGSIYIVGMCGGHADYAGNEINAIALNAEQPAWAEVKPPTPVDQYYDESAFSADLSGGSTHTYYHSQFLDVLDRFVSFTNPGSSFGATPPFDPPPGWPYADSTEYSPSFNWATKAYDPPLYIAKFPTAAGDWTAALCVKHPHTSDVYMARSGDRWRKFTASTRTWSTTSLATGETNYCAAAIDPVRQRMLIVGAYESVNGAPRVRDLDGNEIPVNFGGLGAAALTFGSAFGRYPGCVYDETNDAFLAFYNDPGSNAIEARRVSASTWHVDVPPIIGNRPAARQNGILNAAQYVPELRGVAIANSYSGNLFFLRTAA